MASELSALVVRYEDLITSDLTVQCIEQYLSIEIDPAVLGFKVGSSGRVGEAHVSRLERALLRRAVNPVATSLGYSWGSRG